MMGRRFGMNVGVGKLSTPYCFNSFGGADVLYVKLNPCLCGDSKVALDHRDLGKPV